MKQKLGLCCALIHDPDLLILDEPTTGVDPLSRRQFWELIDRIRADRPGMSVLVATAYMEEAARFDWLVAMDAGHVLATGTPAELLARTGADSLEAGLHRAAAGGEAPRPPGRGDPAAHGRGDGEVAIEAHELTQRFGDFVAVDHVSFRIERGEIFGFLGSNGCGKTTTMKMLTGLLPPTEGQRRLFGEPVDAQRHRDPPPGRLHVAGLLALHRADGAAEPRSACAAVPPAAGRRSPRASQRWRERFDLTTIMDTLPDALPLGIRQRLSLAVAMIHEPEMLILDEPTSGVDPVARDGFWQHPDRPLPQATSVTIFISTHFMNEAERCDRISLMHAGQGAGQRHAAELVAKRGAATLEEAFIGYLEDASGGEHEPRGRAGDGAPRPRPSRRESGHAPRQTAPVSASRRMLGYTLREALELRRDPIRLTLAAARQRHPDVRDGLRDHSRRQEPVLRRARPRPDDRSAATTCSTSPARATSSSSRRSPTTPNSTGACAPASSASRSRSRPASAATSRAGTRRSRSAPGSTAPCRSARETMRGYVQGMHLQWLQEQAARARSDSSRLAAPDPTIEIRYRYNPDFKSLIAMVPAVIPLLLMLIPAMLTALSVVREKELGSIINFYVTPVTRLEFLLGKQLPYVVARDAQLPAPGRCWRSSSSACRSRGAFSTLARRRSALCPAATGIGLLISTFMRSQIAAIFGTAVHHHDPRRRSFSGMIDPVSSLAGLGRADRGRLPDHAIHHDRARHLLQGARLRRSAGGSFSRC